MNPTPSARHAVLTLSCPDVPGIVHAVSGFLTERGPTILQSQQFGDASSARFFMRVEFEDTAGGALDVASLRSDLTPVAAGFSMDWNFTDSAVRRRTVVMVSRFAHCLTTCCSAPRSASQSRRRRRGVQPPRPGPARRQLQRAFPPHPGHPRHRGRGRAARPGPRADVDLVMMARYMQILSEDLCMQLDGKAINIHHSMLPSFKDAKPYHQAHARGVKVIGATAHHVTADLDEGLIIKQELLRVDHSLTPEQLAARGREAETRALARAVRWHAENRVIRSDGRTAVFP